MALPFTLTQFQIERFQCIRRTGLQDMPVDAPWILITGENGDGKTSLLQALALGLYGPKLPINVIHEGILENPDYSIKLACQKNGQIVRLESYFKDGIWGLNGVGPGKNVLGYGPSRLGIQGELTGERTETSPVHTLFHPYGMLYNVEPWLKDFELEARGDPDLLARNRKRMEILASLMPNVERIEIQGSKVVYLEKGFPVPAHHLSSGHKSILAMIGDMWIRLSASQPDIDDPRELQGIVLIDELETHLHPKWQRVYPQKLSEVFPKVQFIATTHSIIPFMGAPEGSVFLRVTRDQERGTQVERLELDVANWLPNTLLTSPLFELDSIVSQQNKNMDDVETARDFAEMQRRQARDARLQQYVREDPAFLAMLTAWNQGGA